MPSPKNIDYANSGLDIQYAMLDQYDRFPKKTERPSFLLWDGLHIRTHDAIPVPERGFVTATFISAALEVRQGFDLKIEGGWLELECGEKVPLLRTWKDERYEDTVRYPFFSENGILNFWNVYEMTWPKGRITEERWTGNAGFWVENIGENRRIYHCSPGNAIPPNFESLVVEIKIESE